MTYRHLSALVQPPLLRIRIPSDAPPPGFSSEAPADASRVTSSHRSSDHLLSSSPPLHCRSAYSESIFNHRAAGSLHRILPETRSLRGEAHLSVPLSLHSSHTTYFSLLLTFPPLSFLPALFTSVQSFNPFNCCDWGQ